MIQFLNKYKSRLYPFYAVADQALQSLINLLSSVFIIRSSTKTEFGIYGVGFSTIVIVSGLMHALVGLQMILLAPERHKDERDTYFMSMFIVMVALSGAFLVLMVFGAIISDGYIPDNYRILLTVIAVSTPGVLTMQFIRQYHYFNGLAGKVLLYDLIFFITYFLLLSSLVYFKVPNIHIWALFINGGIALTIGLTVIAHNLHVKMYDAVALATGNFMEAWQGGFWAAAGSIMTSVQTQGYIYILLTLRGASAVAEINSARLFLSPLLVISGGFSRVMIPKMAILKSEGNLNKAVSLAIKIMFFMMFILIIYMGILFVGWDRLEIYMNSKNYEYLGILIILWCLYFIANLTAMLPSELLQIFREFRILTISSTVTSVGVLAISVPAIFLMGISGAVVAIIIGEVSLALFLWSIFKNRKEEYDRKR